MAAATPSTQAPLLKTIYPQTDIERLMIINSPLMGLIPKRTDFGGDNVTVALRYANTAGVSARFENAQANKAASRPAKFVVTRRRLYSLFSVDNELIHAARGNREAIVDAVTEEVDAAFDGLKLRNDGALYRNGGGAIGRISATSNVTTTTITLATPDDIVNFDVGMPVNLASTDGTSGSVRVGKVKIASMDPDLGTITTETPWNTIIGAAANDYIFPDGDFGAMVQGLDAWVPASAPSATLFNNLDRTVNTQKLGGIRVTGTNSLPTEEAIQKALQVAYRWGAKTSHVIVNDAQFLKLALALGTRRVYTTEETPLGVKYEGLRVIGPGGAVGVYADPRCPIDAGWALQVNTWCLRSAGEFPQFLNKDGSKMLDEPSADALEGRIGGYYNLTCTAPGYNARFPLSTV